MLFTGVNVAHFSLYFPYFITQFMSVSISHLEKKEGKKTTLPALSHRFWDAIIFMWFYCVCILLQRCRNISRFSLEIHLMCDSFESCIWVLSIYSFFSLSLSQHHRQPSCDDGITNFYHFIIIQHGIELDCRMSTVYGGSMVSMDTYIYKCLYEAFVELNPWFSKESSTRRALRSRVFNHISTEYVIIIIYSIEL